MRPGFLLAALVLTAMVAAWKPWLWGAIIVLLIGAGRLNAALGRIGETHKFDEVIGKTALFIVLWGVSSVLAINL